MQSKDIYLLGVGKYTEVIMELALDCGYEVKGLYHYNDQRKGDLVMGVRILGSFEELFKSDIGGLNFGVTMGDNKLRTEVAKKIRSAGGLTPSLIHPKSEISPSAKIGVGCFLHHSSFVWTRAQMGDDCILSHNAHLSHHAIIEDGCSLSVMAMVGPYNTLKKQVFVGIDATVLPGIGIIGTNCLIGAKANVTKAYGANFTLVGNPARPLKK